MMKGNNGNNPQKGSRITVEPIRRVENIQSIKKMLSDEPRNLLLFVLGVNNGLRAGDLLRTRVRDLRGLKPGDSIQIMEGKTGKTNVLVLNKESHRVLRRYLDEVNPQDGDYLFKSRKGGNRPISVGMVNRLVKGWCRGINLRGNYGSHTLRKTWGYHQRVRFGVDFALICRRFNHSNPSVTMRYLGISPSEVEKILMNEI